MLLSKAINLKVEDVFRSNIASHGQSIGSHFKYELFFKLLMYTTVDKGYMSMILSAEHSFPSHSRLLIEPQITPFGEKISMLCLYKLHTHTHMLTKICFVFLYLQKKYMLSISLKSE